jgi:hypothetical protein
VKSIYSSPNQLDNEGPNTQLAGIITIMEYDPHFEREAKFNSVTLGYMKDE